MSTSQFIVERRIDGGRFPFRITLLGPQGPVICVMAADRWPGAGKNIFCLRARQDPEGFEEIDRVPVIEWQRSGARLMFSLDRATQKRAEFLILFKGHVEGKGSREDIYFRTQAAIEAHRSKGKVDLYGQVELTVAIDSQERYPWGFGPEAKILRRKLPAGDYALLIDERIVAAIERKTLENLLVDLYSIKTLHQKMAELSAYRNAAMVVEAQYADLLNPNKIGKCAPSHLVRVISELAVLHPKVQIVWAGNRKLAAAWTAQFFTAAARADKGAKPEALEQTPDLFSQPAFEGGIDQRIRQTALEMGKTGFRMPDLISAIPSADRERVTRVVKGLREEGALVSQGHGRGTLWRLA